MKIIYREFVAVIIGAFFAAYAAYRSGIAREYACKGVLLVMMDNAILVGVDIHILRSSGQLQPTVTVFRRIYVFSTILWGTGAYRPLRCLPHRAVSSSDRSGSRE